MPVDSGTIYSEIRVKLDKLTGDIKSVNSEFDKLEKGTEKTEKAVTKGFEGINIAGVAAFAAIAAGIKGSIEAFSQYEDAMAGVHATMTGTEADFRTLEDAALKAGSTTEFSAKQSAEALKVFTKSGFDAAMSMQLLNTTMTLAKASGTELSVTAQILKTTLVQFSMGADEADRVANVFAASKIPLQELSDTMRVIGPIASGMGFSIEEVVASVKMMAKAGIDGSTAGSSLRLVLSDIGDSSSAMSKKLVEYGVSLDKVNPKTNSLAQIIGELSKAGIGAQESMAIFGARAGGAMSVLIGQGQSAIEDYTKSITGTNEAARQAEIMDNTLGDATKTMANAFEVAGIGLIKELNPAIRFLVDIVTKAVQFFTQLPGPVKLFFGIAAIGIPVIMGLSTAFGVLAGLMTAAVWPIAAVVGGIAAVVAIGAALSGQLKDTSKEWKTQKEWIDANTKSVEEYKKAIIIDPNAGKRSAKELQTAISATDSEIKNLQESLSNTGKTNTGFKISFGDSKDATVMKDQAAEAQKLLDIRNRINMLTAGRMRLIDELKTVEATQGEKNKVLTAEQIEAEKKLADAREDANKKAAEGTTDYFRKTQDLIASDEEGIRLARARAIEEVNGSVASVDAKKKELVALNEYYDALENDKALKKKVDDEKKAADEIEARNEKLKAAIEGFIGGIAGAFQGLFSAIYDQRMKDLDNEMKAEMEAAGVQADTAVETAQKELDAAREGGDAQIIAEKEKALKRAQIEADYEKKKAQLAYEGAHLQWQLTLANALAQAAMVMINAWNSMPFPFNLVPMTLGGIMSGIQIAAVVAAEPKAPTFATGGIVPGEQFSGDHINARLNSGEMVITRAQQARLFAMVNGSDRGGVVFNNEFGNVNSDVDIDRANRILARQVQGAMRSR